MSFCTFSSQAVINEKINLDILFIHEFMPQAPENCTKVYLYGLYICTNPHTQDNDINSFSKHLGISVSEVEDCFHYWKELGLVQILDTIPFTIQYLPVKNALTSIKKYKTDKYSSFNAQAQNILKTRMITPTEYQVYYELIERDHIEQEALLMVMSYCSKLKGTNIGHAYISTVARNWAQEGVTTSEQVEERLKEYQALEAYLGQLYKVLQIKRQPQIEERDLYNKWQKTLGFDEETILQVASLLKRKKQKPSFLSLDKSFEKYKNMNLFSFKEISVFEDQQTQLKETATEILSRLGLYYENLEPVIENYVQNWVQMGYDKQTLSEIATFCFLKSYRTLKAMNSVISNLFKLGVVSLESLEQYLGQLTSRDKEIKSLLEKLGLFRNVNASDRMFHQTWTENWQMSDELLSFATDLAKDKIQPMVYLNKVLSNFFDNKVKTIDEAKAISKTMESTKPKAKKEFFKGRDYTGQDLNVLFDSIDEIEV